MFTSNEMWCVLSSPNGKMHGVQWHQWMENSIEVLKICVFFLGHVMCLRLSVVESIVELKADELTGCKLRHVMFLARTMTTLFSSGMMKFLMIKTTTSSGQKKLNPIQKIEILSALCNTSQNEWNSVSGVEAHCRRHQRNFTGDRRPARARLNAQAFQSAPLLIGSEESKNELYFVISWKLRAQTRNNTNIDNKNLVIHEHGSMKS